MDQEYILGATTSRFTDNFFFFLHFSSFGLIIFFLLRYLFRRKSIFNYLVNTHISLDVAYKNLLMHTPPSSANGWKCIGVFDGCRLWSTNKQIFAGISGDFISCVSFITHTPVKDLIDVFLDPNELFEWNYMFVSNSQVTYIQKSSLNSKYIMLLAGLRFVGGFTTCLAQTTTTAVVVCFNSALHYSEMQKNFNLNLAIFTYFTIYDDLIIDEE